MSSLWTSFVLLIATSFVGMSDRHARSSFSIDSLEYTTVVVDTGDFPCNNARLEKIVTENMRWNAQASQYSIARALEAFAEKYVIVCTQVPFVFSTKKGATICSIKNQDHFCYVFEL